MLKSDEGGALAAELGKAPPPWTGGYLSGGLGKKDRTRYLRYEIGHGWGLLQVGTTGNQRLVSLRRFRCHCMQGA